LLLIRKEIDLTRENALMPQNGGRTVVINPGSSAGRNGAPGGFRSKLLILSMGHLAVDLCIGIWPVYKTLAGIDLTIAGLIATVAGVLSNGLQLIFGVMADRGRQKLLLVGGLLLAGVITFIPRVHSLPLIAVLVLASSIGSSAFHPTATGTASMLAPARAGVMVGLFLTGGYVGFAMSQWMFTFIYRTTGGATEIMFAVPLLTAIAMAWRIETVPRRALSLAGWGKTFAQHFRSLGLLFTIQVCASSLNTGLIFLLPDFLRERGAPDWMLYGGGHAALVMGAALALIPAGHAADRLGARRVLVFLNIAAGILFAWLLLGPCGTWSRLLILAALGAANGGNNVVLVSEGNRSLPGQTGGVSALLMGVPWCIASLMPFIVGHLANPVHGGNTTFALSWLGLAVLGGLAAGSRVPNR
jgi:FSR family fosmidomycin resistance protein-like MFS transporter